MSLLFWIGLVLNAVTLWYVLRYNMHMFQLNTYMNNEQRVWLSRNWKKEGVLILLAVLGLLTSLTNSVVAAVLYCLLAGFVLYYFRFLKRYHTKITLKFTTRTKRMIATDLVLCAVALGLTLWLAGPRWMWLACGLLILGQMVLLMAANVINQPMEKAVKQHYIDDAMRLLAEKPDMKIIGITGSYGKTSVKHYLYTLLRQHFDVLITPGNFNTPMGVVITVREHLRPKHQIFLCEMGARYVGEIKEICDIAHPDMGIITSIGPQHLDTFGSIENVTKTKFELADALPEGGLILLNGDNEYIRENSGKYKDKVFFSTDGGEEGYTATDIKVSSAGTTFTIHAPSGESCAFRTRLVGKHNVINITGAIACAHILGVPLEELRIPVQKLQPVSHRMEMSERGGATIIDDSYNSNPIGSKAAVETLALFEGTRILITPGMVELGEDEERYNYLLGTYAADCCDYIALVGKKHTEPILKGILDKGFPESKVQVFRRVEDAMAYANKLNTRDHKYILIENDLPDNY